MRIYLGTCSIQRPLDSKNRVRMTNLRVKVVSPVTLIEELEA